MIRILFLAISLFLAQMVAVIHGAEHGFEEHEHDGDVCQISLYCQQTDHQTSDTVSSVGQLALSACACPPYGSAENMGAIAKFAIRAPPSFS